MARWDDDSLWAPAAPVTAAAPAKPKAVRWDDDALWGDGADFGNVQSSGGTVQARPVFTDDEQEPIEGPVLGTLRAAGDRVASYARGWKGLGQEAIGGVIRAAGDVYDEAGAAGRTASAFVEAAGNAGVAGPYAALPLQSRLDEAAQIDPNAVARAGAGIAESGRILQEQEAPNTATARPDSILESPGQAFLHYSDQAIKSAPYSAVAFAPGGLPAIGVAAGGAKYNQLKEEGYGTGEAIGGGVVGGGLEILTEKIPVDIAKGTASKWLAPLIGDKAAATVANNVAARVAGTTVAESGSEAINSALQDTYDTFALDKSITFDEFARNMKDAFLTGAATSGPMAAAGLAMQRPRERLTETGDQDVDAGAEMARMALQAADDAAARQPPPIAPVAAPAAIPTPAPSAQADALDELLREQAAIAPEPASEGQSAQVAAAQPAPVFEDADPGLVPADTGMPSPAADLPGPDAGPVVQVPDARAAEAAAPEAPTAAPRVRGAAGRAFTGAGESVDFDYAVVESDDLVPSNDTGGRVNPRYPRELQPRDRTTPESRASVAVIAKNLNPERLGESQDIVNGAPLVGDDLVVESGNGRVMALQGADTDRQAAYRQWVEANAGRFGVDGQAVKGMRSPVLVRVRRGELDMTERARLGREGNRSTALGMSPTEKAKADAALVTDDMMAAWAPSEDGDPLATSNQPFIRQFLSGLGANEAAELSSNGRLTKQAADRLQAAVFAKAYGDPRLINLFASEADPQIKNVLSALSRGAGSFARAKAKGAEDAGLDMSANLAEAASLMLDAKDKGMNLRTLLDQGDMFGGGRDPVSTGLALYFADNARAPRRMGELIEEVGSLVEKELQARSSGDMFGRQDANRADILNAAQAATAEQPARAAALLSQGPTPGRGGGEGQQPAAGRAAAGDAAGDGAVAGPLETAPDISQQLLDRYEADPEGVLAEYAALKDDKGKNVTDGGRHIDTDLFRELSAAYRANRRLAGKIHKAASFITKDAFKKLLAGPVKQGRNPTVFMLGGGGGSGKSSVTEALRAEANPDITLDGTLSNLDRARKDIAASLEKKRDVVIAFVYRTPLLALKGAIQRAAGKENGRIVPTWALAEAHANAPDVVRALAKEYDGDRRVTFTILDNSGTKEEVKEVGVADIPEVPSEQDLKRQFDEYIQAEHAAGRLSDDLYQAFSEPKPAEERSAAPAGLRSEAGRRPEGRPAEERRDAVTTQTPPTGGVSASGPTSSAAPATATLDMPKMTASRLADLEIEVEASDGKQSKTVKVNAYKVLRRAMQRLDAINSLMECVRRG